MTFQIKSSFFCPHPPQISQLEGGVGRNPLTQLSSPWFLLNISLIKKPHCGWLLGPTTHRSLDAELKAARQKGVDSSYIVSGQVCQSSNQRTVVLCVTYSTFVSFSSNAYELGTWRQLMTEVNRAVNFLLPLPLLLFLFRTVELTEMVMQYEWSDFSMIHEKWFNIKNKPKKNKHHHQTTAEIAYQKIMPTVPATSTQKNQKDKDTYGQTLPLQRKIVSALFPGYTTPNCNIIICFKEKRIRESKTPRNSS